MHTQDRRKQARERWREMAVGAVVPVAAVLLWQWVAMNGWVNPQVLPAPLDVWRKWVAYLLPLVHVDFALSEVEYFHAITQSRANADVAYDTFLRGHAAWFGTRQGQSLLQAIRNCA